MEYFEHAQIDRGQEFSSAQGVAKSIFNFMCTEEISRKISETHRVNAKSHQIQAIILPRCIELGMSSEKKGLFSSYATAQLRPDYYLRLNNTGLIMEVERGKTIANNMDLLDIWKCHICEEANYLLLVVPIIRQTYSGGSIKIYEHVIKRTSSFFAVQNYVNVNACFIIGY